MREPQRDNSAAGYERPNQPWVCGLADKGHACAAGPTARGGCPAMAECMPVRDGDRWVCDRSQLRGGPCDVGPTPDGGCGRVLKCSPARSLRAIRGRFVRACALLVAGAAVLALSASWRDQIIAPGPLAEPHAQLMERSDAAANCAACHAAASENVTGWMASLVSTGRDSPSQSQLCMKCHDKTISPQLALEAHNMPAGVLAQLTSIRTVPLPGHKKEERSISCAACHSEHHGSRADLTAIDNVACQTCHQQRYESFAVDHPDFGIWPYERRTRIAFNHAAHRDKHFAEKKQAIECRACHVDDKTGAVQLLASYETTCAGCHDEKISTSVARGVPMLALPTLDVAALRSAGFDIGGWPKVATGDFDGRLPPAMKLLLAGDSAAAQAMAKLGADFDFQDVNPKDRGQLEACATLAAAIKKLVPELAGSAGTSVRFRLQAALGHPISEAQATALVAGLSADTLQIAATNWFTGENAGKAASAAAPNIGTKTLTKADHKQRPIVFAPAGDWLRDETSLSVRYRPKGHADPVFATWLNVLAETPDLNQRPIAAAAFKELSKPTAPGLCVSCHSVERSAANELVVNWRSYDRTIELRGFTKFSHGPHLLLPQLADCTHCHSIDSAAGTAAVYADVVPTQFVSDFAPLSKRQCIECHTARAAGDRCQSCHNYHVEGSGFGVQGSRLWVRDTLEPEPLPRISSRRVAGVEPQASPQWSWGVASLHPSHPRVCLNPEP